MARTVWFSIKALERRNYFSLSEKDFLITDAGDEFTKKLILMVANKTKKNSNTINSKVDSMVMAQEYFKRAIVVVSLYAFVLLFFYISKSNLSLSCFGKRIILYLNSINLNGWNIVILYILAITAIILSIRVSFLKK